MKMKYKVVKRKSRMSAMINGNSKYARQYLDGHSVYAPSNTVGILVFETLSAAEDWAWIWNHDDYHEDKRDLIVLEVYPIGRGKRVLWLANDISTDVLDYFYDRVGESCWRAEAPDRTMAYPGVAVIGEYERA